MIIFVYGDDTFRVQEKVTEMRKRFSEKFDPSGMNLAEFKDKAKIGDVMQAVQSPPFLGEKRMAIVRDLCPGLKKADSVPWAEGFLKTPESTILILWETASPKKLEKTALFKALSKSSDVHKYPFPSLSAGELGGWIRARAKTMRANIDSSAAQELIRRVGPDLWRMQQELEKLHAYANGGLVDSSLVKQMVPAQFEDQIFAFVDAVSRKDMRGALRLLEEQRLYGAADHQIFSMLTRQIRILLGARALLDEQPYATKQDLADAMGIHPFVAQKSLGQAESFTIEQLRAAHRSLFKLDLAMKTGKIQADLAVDLTVLKLSASR